MVNAYEAAAELLVDSYLAGRAIDPSHFRALVRAAHRRLMDERSPVLDIAPRGSIDGHAGQTYSVPPVVARSAGSQYLTWCA